MSSSSRCPLVVKIYLWMTYLRGVRVRQIPKRCPPHRAGCHRTSQTTSSANEREKSALGRLVLGQSGAVPELSGLTTLSRKDRKRLMQNPAPLSRHRRQVALNQLRVPSNTMQAALPRPAGRRCRRVIVTWSNVLDFAAIFMIAASLIIGRLKDCERSLRSTRSQRRSGALRHEVSAQLRPHCVVVSRGLLSPGLVSEIARLREEHGDAIERERVTWAQEKQSE